MLISYDVIKKVIDKWDPVELLCIHAPSDEYDSETKEIFDEMNKLEFIEVGIVANIIFSVFSESFGHDVFTLTIGECRTVAQKIIDISKDK